MLTEHRGKAMGTTVHIAAVGVTADDVAGVFGRIADRSRRWTRFSPDSELATLNRANGLPCVLSSDTAALLKAAVDGWRSTGGRFDPSIHDAMIAAGYDRTFAEGPGPGGPAISAPGLHDLQIDVASATVLAPSNLRLDFGGIGKGFAADLAVSELLDAGAHHAAVSIGGDLRAAGHPEAGWPIAAEPWADLIASLADGGFCFSTTERRQWSVDGDHRHHILDPATGRPADGAIRHVAVAASTATQAEVQATAAVVAGWPAALDALETAELDGFVVTEDGTAHHFGAWTPNPSISLSSADRTP